MLFRSQKVAPLAGKTGETIMLATYPVSQPEKIDADAETFVARLKESIDAVRNLRGEMNVSPKDRVPLYVTGDEGLLQPQLPYLLTLGKLSEIHPVENLPDSNAPVAVVSSGKMMLDIQIDPAAETARISKEITRLEGEIGRAEVKLGNASFVDRAPPAVVDQEKKRLMEFRQKLAELVAQRTRLK